MNILLPIIIAALLHLCYTDFKELKVNALVMLVAGVGLATKLFFSAKGSFFAFSTFLPNLVFTALLLCIILLYTRIRGMHLFKAFAMGDVLFVVVAVFAFAPINFVVFIMLSSFIGIVYALIRKVNTDQQKKIPFAGIMAGTLAALLAVEWVGGFNLLSDLWIIQRL